jgi:hypothetical protein
MRILRYVDGTIDFGIMYSTSKDFRLIGYTDNDYGGNIDDIKSTSLYIFHFGIGMVSWESRKKPIVTLSSREVRVHHSYKCNLSSNLDEKNVKGFVATNNIL